MSGQQARPCVSVDPKVRFGEPVLHGTRLPVLMLAERYWYLGEYLESEILQAYEITMGDLVVCCYYVARYGSRTWRKRWGEWLRQIDRTTGENSGWWADLNTLPLPPDRGSTS